jgi:hypothetical protein
MNDEDKELDTIIDGIPSISARKAAAKRIAFLRALAAATPWHLPSRVLQAEIDEARQSWHVMSRADRAYIEGKERAICVLKLHAASPAPEHAQDSAQQNESGRSGDLRKSETPQGGVGTQMPGAGSIPAASHQSQPSAPASEYDHVKMSRVHAERMAFESWLRAGWESAADLGGYERSIAWSAWQARAALAAPPAQWISVKDRLPPNTKAVLVWEPVYQNTFTANWRDGNWWHFGTALEAMQRKPSHWMPLPSAPPAQEKP